MKFKVFIERKALKQLEGLEEEIKVMIEEKLKELKRGFSPRLDIKKLYGYESHYRLRAGKYRILFEIERGRIVVYSILPRRKAYR